MPRVARVQPAPIIEQPQAEFPESPPSTALVSSSSAGAGTDSPPPHSASPVAPAAALSPVAVSSETFALMLGEETKKRALLKGYVGSHLMEGVDFGRISFGNGRESKPSLFKPGAEKICSLLNLKPEFQRDGEFYEMLGDSAKGWIAFTCRLFTVHGAIAAEGRGAAGPRHVDLNTRLKMAQKSAQIDATLRVAALSDYFTQDLEDMQREAPAPASEADSKPAEGGSTPPGAATTVIADSWPSGKPAPATDSATQASRDALRMRNQAMGALYSEATRRGIPEGRLRSKCHEILGHGLSDATEEEIRNCLRLMKEDNDAPAGPAPEPGMDAPTASDMSEADVEGQLVDIEGAHPACSKERALGYARLITVLRGQPETEIVKNCKRGQQHLKIEDKPYEKMTQKERADLEEQLKRWVRSLSVVPF